MEPCVPTLRRPRAVSQFAALERSSCRARGQPGSTTSPRARQDAVRRRCARWSPSYGEPATRYLHVTCGALYDKTFCLDSVSTQWRHVFQHFDGQEECQSSRLSRDSRAEPAASLEAQLLQECVRTPSVNDVRAGHPRVESLQAAGDLRNHASNDNVVYQGSRL